jgi:UDP-4-amino-4,6-dideoxy-N-acetyl-beta-L-altrosamine transaminase
MKKIPYGRQWVDDKDIEAVRRTLKSAYLTQGRQVQIFEEALALYCGAKYAVALSSGTAALHAACFAAGIKEGNEVITSPITFAASANCVLYRGGMPVFADIEEDTVNIGPEEIKKNITKRTKAVIPVHFAGHPCDLGEISSIAKEHNLVIIEDGAHALGAEYKESKIGACKYSDMTIFSFHPVKAITTGEGGAVLTNSRKYYERLRLFRVHGITKEQPKLKAKNSKMGLWFYEMQELGFNYRITDFQCALGVSQLKKLNRFIERRREIVNIYNRKLSEIDEIALPQEKPCVKSAWHIYCIRLRNHISRRVVFDEFCRRGIGVQVHYIPLYYHPYYRSRGYKKNLWPNAEKYYRQTITLPIYPKMVSVDINRVVKATKDIVKEYV